MLQQRKEMESLYREMMEMREHLLRRIEMLEDDVERLTEENYQYSKELYTIQKDVEDSINSLSEYLRVKRFEGQEGSKTDY